MRANEFVKKYGWDLTEMIVDKALHIGMFRFDMVYLSDIEIHNLENLIESYRIINSHGGLEKAKNFLCEPYPTEDTRRVAQAILDVESCQ